MRLHLRRERENAENDQLQRKDNRMTLLQSRTLRHGGILLALGGGLLALCAFFFLPYFSIETLVETSHASTSISVRDVSVTGAQLARKDFSNLPALARLHPGEGIVNSGYYQLENAYGAGEEFPFLWLEPLAAVMAIVLAAVLLLFRRKPVMTNGPWLCIWLLIGLALITLISLLARYRSDLSFFWWDLVSYSWGFWAVLLGMFLVAVGAGTVRLSWAGEPLRDRENGREPASVPHSTSDKRRGRTS